MFETTASILSGHVASSASPSVSTNCCSSISRQRSSGDGPPPRHRFRCMNHGSGAEQVFREGSRARSNFQHRASVQVARHGGDGVEVRLVDEEVLAEAPVVGLPGLKAGDEVDGASHAFTGRSISTSRGWRFRSRISSEKRCASAPAPSRPQASSRVSKEANPPFERRASTISSASSGPRR